MLSPACFGSYDIRGKIGHTIDTDLAFRIGAAFASVMQPKTVVVGRDCRPSSPELAQAVINGLRRSGVDVIDIGLSGTEEMYFATDHFGASGGITITASHNPIDYNGMKMVAEGSRPLTDVEFRQIGLTTGGPMHATEQIGTCIEASARATYANHLVDMIDTVRLRPTRMVVNACGVAGPAFDAVLDTLRTRGPKVEVTRLNHEPDPAFRNGIPNPMLPEQHAATGDVVVAARAQFGVAWDGDFDRCFFFDETGAFVDGEYVVALLAQAALARHPAATIIHDPRIVWNTQRVVSEHGGVSHQSKTGHAYLKAAMRETGAIYGGEMSAHHYFSSFMNCDSGMIPWLMMAELLSITRMPLSQLVAEMKALHPSSGELNFTVTDPETTIAQIKARYLGQAVDVENCDGLSMSFETWRFNLRCSNTESLLRLNVETRGDPVALAQHVHDLTELMHPTETVIAPTRRSA